ncbi:MAG: 30S ribosomal protein S4e [Candidatus Aenigmarchaeota archaeon]|nr:30S ribosomal protein S4e [Candidatus Aenigmarchaeota archaeon]
MHLKRLIAPDSYRQKGKELKFSVKVSPGPHKAENSIPLSVVLKDILKYASITKEAKRIISKREILVDGRVRTNTKLGVGFMDILSIPKIDEFYRVSIKDKRLALIPIDKKEGNDKICQLVGKKKGKKGIIQLSLHDGRNILIDSKDKNVSNYKLGDSLQISLPEQKIKKHMPLNKDASVMITDGKNKGLVGTVIDIQTTKGFKPPLYVIKTEDEEHITIKPYVFVVGEKKPLIAI